MQDRMPFGLPGGSGLRDGLIGPRFIFIELYDPIGFGLRTGQLNQACFFQRLQVVDQHRAAFALAQRVARAAPGARLLIAVTRFMQNLTNGFFGNVGQIG